MRRPIPVALLIVSCLLTPQGRAGDWPQFRYDAGRTAASPHELPANLQGKWNEDLKPPWECDLHHDVNLQMNYWPAEVCNLADCIEPLLNRVLIDQRCSNPIGQQARSHRRAGPVNHAKQRSVT